MLTNNQVSLTFFFYFDFLTFFTQKKNADAEHDHIYHGFCVYIEEERKKLSISREKLKKKILESLLLIEKTSKCRQEGIWNEFHG